MIIARSNLHQAGWWCWSCSCLSAQWYSCTTSLSPQAWRHTRCKWDWRYFLGWHTACRPPSEYPVPALSVELKRKSRGIRFCFNGKQYDKTLGDENAYTFMTSNSSFCIKHKRKERKQLRYTHSRVLVVLIAVELST